MLLSKHKNVKHLNVSENISKCTTWNKKPWSQINLDLHFSPLNYQNLTLSFGFFICKMQLIMKVFNSAFLVARNKVSTRSLKLQGRILWDEVNCKNTHANGNTDILTMKPGLKRNPGNTEQPGFRNIVVQNPRRVYGLSYGLSPHRHSYSFSLTSSSSILYVFFTLSSRFYFLITLAYLFMISTHSWS